ncbi:MAG: MFS transporter, partial [Verrucomicrobiota bacterium]|nr:MFS transporter [Verrucomicrobiota bacterium]
TIIQERAPDQMRGRVSAVAGLSFFGILPFSGLVMSALADGLGLRMALLVSAACFGGVTALLLGGRRQLASAPRPAEGP